MTFPKAKKGLESKQTLQILRYNSIVEETHWKGRGTGVAVALSLAKSTVLFLLLFYISRLLALCQRPVLVVLLSSSGVLALPPCGPIALSSLQTTTISV